METKRPIVTAKDLRVGDIVVLDIGSISSYEAGFAITPETWLTVVEIYGVIFPLRVTTPDNKSLWLNRGQVLRLVGHSNYSSDLKISLQSNDKVWALITLPSKDCREMVIDIHYNGESKQKYSVSSNHTMIFIRSLLENWSQVRGL